MKSKAIPACNRDILSKDVDAQSFIASPVDNIKEAQQNKD